MSSSLDFLKEATENKVLQKLREEVKPKGVYNEIEDEDVDELKAIDVEENEELAEPKKAPKAPQRRTSQTLLDLIHKYQPKLKCNSSDANCLVLYIANNITKFDMAPEKLKPHLERLQTLGRAIQPVTSSQRNYFVELTSLFKRYWVPKGEIPKPPDEKSGPHIFMVRQILRADKSAVAVYIVEKDAKLLSKLKDKFDENWEDLEKKVRQMYATVDDSPRQVDNNDLASLMLSISCSLGCRKGEILDPNVLFLTYPDYVRREERAGRDISKFRLGTFLDADEDSDEEENVDKIITVDKDLFDESIGLDRVVCQIGVLKDSEQAINRFIDEDDERWVADRVLIKPSIVLTARQIVDGIRRFRKIENITKANFPGRRVAGNRWGTAKLQPTMKKYFPRAYAKSIANGWPFSSHYGRKIYANASFEIYQEHIKRVTNRYIDKVIWVHCNKPLLFELCYQFQEDRRQTFLHSARTHDETVTRATRRVSTPSQRPQKRDENEDSRSPCKTDNERGWICV